ncbi:MAG: hypothetical protein WC269_00585 [Candidatus Gracilibacteria bacterium]
MIRGGIFKLKAIPVLVVKSPYFTIANFESGSSKVSPEEVKAIIEMFFLAALSIAIFYDVLIIIALVL